MTRSSADAEKPCRIRLLVTFNVHICGRCAKEPGQTLLFVRKVDNISHDSVATHLNLSYIWSLTMTLLKFTAESYIASTFKIGRQFMKLRTYEEEQSQLLTHDGQF